MSSEKIDYAQRLRDELEDYKRSRHLDNARIARYLDNEIQYFLQYWTTHKMKDSAELDKCKQYWTREIDREFPLHEDDEYY